MLRPLLCLRLEPDMLCLGLSAAFLLVSIIVIEIEIRRAPIVDEPGQGDRHA